MELQLSGSKKKIDLPDVVFGCEFNEPLVHQVVTAYLSAARAGTAAQKTRAEVRGGGSKPWNQKGGGRARAGTIRSPIWRKGGVVFAAKPRSYDQKVNKKMYRGAMRSILSELARSDRLIVVESFDVDQPKTKQMIAKLNDLNIGTDALIISNEVSENFYLAARNLPNVEVCDVAAVDPVSLIRVKKVLVTLAALKQLEELLK